MPNAAATVSAQQTPPASRLVGDQDQDRDHSADESWSAADSDLDRFPPNGSTASNALKRKRPLTVSYVLFSAPVLGNASHLLRFPLCPFSLVHGTGG